MTTLKATAATGLPSADLEYFITQLRGAELVFSMVFAELIAERSSASDLPDLIRERFPSLREQEIVLMTRDQHDALIHAAYTLGDQVRAVRAIFDAQNDHRKAA